MLSREEILTFAAVMFEICAFRPDCRSGAVSTNSMSSGGCIVYLETYSSRILESDQTFRRIVSGRELEVLFVVTVGGRVQRF